MHRWGGYTIDPARRELLLDGDPVHLEPQAFDVLLYLVEHRDRVVAKEELLDEIWGHRFTSETSLTTRIKEARRATGDDGDRQHTIKNVRGRGYRFVADVATDDRRWRGGELVGRRSDLDDVVRLLETAPLVTLVGPGGVGKSTLARVAAEIVGPRRRDGACIVELAPLAVGSAIVPSVARALNVVVEDVASAAAVHAIARRDVLLVLDNCEHVVDHVTTLVEQLLHATDRRVALLTTSQVRLGTSAEVVVAVRPLTVDEATDLFAERARAARGHFDAATVGRERVARLVQALDCLPLTIEMAAARLGALTFDELEDAVKRQRPLLQMSHRSPAVRHRSLPAIVEWSADLLEPSERQVFTDFSVFAGAVAATDAEAVVGGDDNHGSSLFTMAALADRSLLAADTDGTQTRFGMLATVRAVADRWLEESGRAEMVRRRHAEHVLDVVRDVDDRIRAPDEADARRRLADIVDEVRAAHRWARANDVLLASEITAALFHASYTALWFEPAEWSRLLLAEVDDPASAVADRLMLAGLAANRGDPAFAREHATALASVADGRLRASALEVLADAALYEGAFARAEDWSHQLIELGHELGDRHYVAIGTVNASLGRTYGGDAAGALALLDAADTTDLAPTDEAWLAYARGDALSAARSPDAPASYLTAIELGTSVMNHLVVVVSYDSLAAAYMRAGDITRAVETFATAVDGYRRHGNHTHAAEALTRLAALFAAVGDETAAAQMRVASGPGVTALEIDLALAEAAERLEHHRA